MQASDERLGIVRLSLPDGRVVPLRFTWARIDAMGRDWIISRFEQVIKGEAGCQLALMELLALASGNQVSPALFTQSDAPVVGFEDAFKALESAWMVARFGPTRRPAEDGTENPQKPRLMRWGLRWKR